MQHHAGRRSSTHMHAETALISRTSYGPAGRNTRPAGMGCGGMDGAAKAAPMTCANCDAWGCASVNIPDRSGHDSGCQALSLNPLPWPQQRRTAPAPPTDEGRPAAACDTPNGSERRAHSVCTHASNGSCAYPKVHKNKAQPACAKGACLDCSWPSASHSLLPRAL